MSNLKSKLAEKIVQDENQYKVIDEFVTEDNKVGKEKQILEKKENIIVPEFAISITEAKERVLMLQNFVKEMMIPNIDYGVIPNCNKPSLFKAGAEKLCDVFGFSKQIEILNRIEDWDKGLFHYEVKAILVNKKTGLIEAEGIGSCNSKERKYKNQDSYSMINTFLKMAKKRALIDAVLSATRSSGIFTQDMEDINFNEDINNNRFKHKQIEIKNELLTKEQQTEILVTIAKNNIPVEYAKSIMQNKFNVKESKELTKVQANEFIDILKCCSII